MNFYKINKWLSERKNLKEAFFSVFKDKFLFGALIGMSIVRFNYMNFLSFIFSTILTLLLWTLFFLFTKSRRF